MSNLKLEITSKAYIDIETITDYIAKDKKSGYLLAAEIILTVIFVSFAQILVFYLAGMGNLYFIQPKYI